MKTTLTITLLVFLFSCKKEVEIIAPVEKPMPPIAVADTVIIADTIQPPGGFSYTKRKANLLNQKSWTKKVQKDTLTGEYKNVVLLEFNGYDATKTMWNVKVGASGSTPEEQRAIVDSANKYYKYKGFYFTLDEELYNKCRPDKRFRVVLTDDWEWYGAAGGVAYRNSFFWANETPAFVFTSLLKYNVQYIGRAVAHEAGHAFGLAHQSLWVNGVKVNEYNPGNAAMCPIMGYLYSGAVAEWYTGLDPFGNKQYDGRIIEEAGGGKYDGQGNFKPWGTY